MKKLVFVILSVAVLCSCGTGKNVDVSKAILGDWEIVEAGGTAVEPGFDKATISFDGKGGVHGNTSINYFFGEYSLKGDGIEFGNIGLTKMLGPTPDVEKAVVDGLNTGVKVKFEDNDNAVVLSKDGTEVLKLKRTELKEDENDGTPVESAGEPVAADQKTEVVK